MFPIGANPGARGCAQIKQFYSNQRARLRLWTRDWRLSSFRQSAAAVENAADLLRAPANLLLMGPHTGMKLAGLLAHKLGVNRQRE